MVFFCLEVYAQDLGIQLDNQAASRGNFVWGSIIDVKDANAISDEELKALAGEAYNEMTENFQSTRQNSPPAGFPKSSPSVMVALLAGDTLYFASSLKRGTIQNQITPFTVLSGRAVRSRVVYDVIIKELYRCQCGAEIRLSDSEQGHANGGACGEIMASLYWSLDASSRSAQDLQGARIVAVNGVGGEIEVVFTCSGRPLGRGAYGCSDFTHKLGLKTVDPIVNGNLDGRISIPPPFLDMVREPRHGTIVCPR